jgi:hypothetical protein
MFLSEREAGLAGTSLIDGWHWRVGLQDAKMDPGRLVVTVEEVRLDPSVNLIPLDLQSAQAQRIRAALLDPSAVDEGIRQRGGVSPDGTFVILDVASADAFRYPYLFDPSRLAFWIGRLPIRCAVFGPHARVFLEFFREVGLDDCVYIGREFRPLTWEIQGNRVWLVCLPGG